MFKELFNFNNYHYNPHAIPVMLAGALVFCIGIFILLQTKKTIRNIAFFFFCMSLSLWLFPMGFVYCSNNPQTALLWYKHFVFFGVINIMPNFYLFSTATSGFLNKQRPFVWAGFIISNLFYLATVMTDKIITTPRLYFWGYFPHYRSLTAIFFIVYAALFITSEINLWVAYKREEVSIKRTQILIIFFGLIIGFIASFDFVAKFWQIPLYPFGFIPSFILSSMVAYSVIKHEAFDIETVIHKTILWALSFTIITIPIFLFYRWVFPVMKDSAFLQAVFGIMSFIVFALYLRLIQPKIDHIFQRRKADIDEISNRFTEDLVHLKGLDNLIRYIEATITNTIYSQWTDIFIYDENEGQYVAANRNRLENRPVAFDEGNNFLEWLKEHNQIVYREFVDIDPVYAPIKQAAKDYFDLSEATVAIPLILNEQLLGIVNLDKKANLRRYSGLDFHFLRILKNQSAIAISNSLIYQNIERQVSQRTEELVAVQKQLIQAEKLATVGTLSGGVAHEINNPLTAILTNVQMLLAFSDEKVDPEDKESLKLIEEATQRCRTIVQKLMTYAKKPLKSGEVEKINVLDVLKKAIAFLEYQLEQDDVKIILEAKEDDYSVTGNHNELEQVLTNIILNARDAICATGKKGNIEISLSKPESQIRIRIKDDGKGIAPDVIPKIFDPFFTTKDVGKGLGLGLSICQSIIESHKGRIKVKSEPDNGAAFTIVLPRHSQVAASCKVGD